jgi:DNA repair exonuclease SbcCD ATPase subunit
MIERLELTQWRAFDYIELRLDGGTTFVVAQNGVGKSSLVLGMAWALFGDDALVDAPGSVRAGADTAATTITVRVGEGALTVNRTVTTKNKQTAAYDLDGKTLSETDFRELILSAFGVSPVIAARLAVMVGGGHVASTKALDLRTHLYDAFGVTAIQRAADRAKAIAAGAKKQREAMRTTVRTVAADRAVLGDRRAALEIALAGRAKDRGVIEVASTEARQIERDRDAWVRHDDDTERWTKAIVSIVADAEPLGFTGPPEELADWAASEVDRLQAQVASYNSERVTAEARVLAARSALALLQQGDPLCPTCRRGFHGGELASAINEQQAELEAAQEISGTLITQSAIVEGDLKAVTQISAGLHRVGVAPVPPSNPRPGPAIPVVDAAEELRTYDIETGVLQRDLELVRADLAAADASANAEAEQRRVYRYEAAATATADALSAVATDLVSRHIEPIARRIQWRWKMLFGQDGLQLEPDGSIVRVVGERRLGWDSLSGGEQIWARLVSHLLMLDASTSIPFAWFDEPLESLDPRARRAVAYALATATRAGRPAQVIVTTYEDAIARQLAGDVAEASITHIRRVDA